MISWLIFVRSNEQYQKTFEFLQYDADFSTGSRYVIKGPISLREGGKIQGKEQYLLGLSFYGNYGEDINEFLDEEIVNSEDVIFLSDLDEKYKAKSFMKEEDLLAYLTKINFKFEDGSFPAKLLPYDHSLRRTKERKSFLDYIVWIYIIESRNAYYKFMDYYEEEIFFWKRGFRRGQLILLEDKLELKDGKTIGNSGEMKVLITFSTESKKFVDNMIQEGILDPDCLVNADKIQEKEFDTKPYKNMFKKGKTMKYSSDLAIYLYKNNFKFQDNSRFHWHIPRDRRKGMMDKDYEKYILDALGEKKIQYNEVIEDDIHYSRHYLCDICRSFEHNMRYYKKEDGKWKEVEWNKADDEAEIALAYCYKCNNPERVHAEDCLNKSYENRLLPSEYRFWDWKKGSLITNSEKIYEELFGLRDIGHTFITYYSKIIVGMYTFLDKDQDEEVEALFTGATLLYHALCSWVFGEKSPKIVYPYLITFIKEANNVKNKDFSPFLDYINWVSEDLNKVLEENQMDDKAYVDTFTLNKDREKSGVILLLWRLGYFLGRIIDISQTNDIPILFDSFKSIQALFDALGDWVFGRGILQKIKVRFETFDHALQFEQDPAYHGIFKEVKITRDNIESFIKNSENM